MRNLIRCEIPAIRQNLIFIFYHYFTKINGTIRYDMEDGRLMAMNEAHISQNDENEKTEERVDRNCCIWFGHITFHVIVFIFQYVFKETTFWIRRQWVWTSAWYIHTHMPNAYGVILPFLEQNSKQFSTHVPFYVCFLSFHLCYITNLTQLKRTVLNPAQLFHRLLLNCIARRRGSTWNDGHEREWEP